MKFCAKCGAQLIDGADNCPSCGAPVEATVPAEKPTVVTNNAPAASGTATGRAMAIVSFVCGIVGVISCSGISLGTIALIFGIVARKEGNKSSMSTAGIVLGSVSLGMYVLLIAAYILLMIAYVFIIVMAIIGAAGMEGMGYYL